MDQYNSTRERYTRRRPLVDVPGRANKPSVVAYGEHEPMSSPKMPHHESLKPDGAHLPLSPPRESHSPGAIENKRLSNVIHDFQPPNPNRNSAISTASSSSGKSRRKTHVGPWQLGKTLGKGAIGRVRIARHSHSGQITAIKIISRNNKKMQPSESLLAMDRNVGIPAGKAGARWMPHGIEREVVIMKLINHPNIMSIYDVWENRGELYLVLEYVQGGELFDYVSSRGRLQEHEAVRLFRQMIAGLSYCHRLGICHRDLKPENILLDKDCNIKLADFGMATLQASGQMLRTSCGSPHYASPEIISGHRYSGAKADIWSVGVILYAMLAGTLPFDCGGDMDALMRTIRKGRYVMQPWFTPEAQDLIQRILVVNPHDRISMDEIWEHKLLKKYERYLLNMFGPTNIGVRPSPDLTEEECGERITSEAHIQPELLRNVQTLWHSTDPKTVLRRVMSEKPTLERWIYNALVRYHEEYLENYIPAPLESSASDYCHIIRPIPRNISKKYLQNRPQSRASKRSEFSILSDNRRPPRRDSSSVRTIGSYDPYRSSRNQVTAQASYTNVTVWREDNPGQGGSKSRPRGDSIKHPAINRLQAEEGLYPESSERTFGRTGNSRLSMRSTQTRSSMGTFNGHNVVQSRRAGYKRNVSFRHARHRSTDSTCAASVKLAASDFSYIPEIPDRTSSLDMAGISYLMDNFSSPDLPQSPLRNHNRKGSKSSEQLGVRRIRTDQRPSSHFWKEEARKVSTELGKICEEAFNRSSMSSSAPSNNQNDLQDYSTPHTSFSEQGSSTGYDSYGRAVPGSSKDEYGDIAMKELAATRRRLIEHSARSGEAAHLDDVIKHLDRLLSYGGADQNGEIDKNRRAASDPTPKTVPGLASMPQSDSPYNLHSSGNWVLAGDETPRRVVSEPTRRYEPSIDSENTIRLVPLDDISALPHLPPAQTEPASRIAFREQQKQKAKGSTAEPQDHIVTQTIPHNRPPIPRGVGHNDLNPLSSPNATLVNHQFETGLEPIEESPAKQPENLERKRSWFRKNKSQSFESKNNQPSSKTSLPLSPVPEDSGAVGEAAPKAIQEKKSSSSVFKKIFKKRSEDKMGLQIAADSSTEEWFDTEKAVARGKMGDFDFSSRMAKEPSVRNLPSRRIQPEQTWIARMLHIKPACMTVCFNIARPRARREILKILKGWRKYGIENLHSNRQSNLIFGSVAAKNRENLKPVDFACELFVVLQHGRYANLSIARFTQERGAASSFHKVIDTLQYFLYRRGLLVEDKEKAKKMAQMIPK